ncbi:nitroreductase family protein [Streptomyces mirabilis]|uniref:nitroreductase family protein n=1 Tax=Streptomyces mirabilis TaxID=68239 RepID=UPI0037FACAD1
MLTTTRSVRRRLDLTRPVDIVLVRECLRIALQAPNGSNVQRWRWIVVTDPDRRVALADLYRKAWQQRGDERTGDPRVHDSAGHLAENLHRVPVLVIPCLELPGEELPHGNQAGLWGSLLPAAWSYMLAARTRKLGTAWTTLHLKYEHEAADLLGLPGKVRQGALIPTAHVRGAGFRPAWRLPLGQVVRVDRW